MKEFANPVNNNENSTQIQVIPPPLAAHQGATKRQKISPSIVLNIAHLRIQGEGWVSNVHLYVFYMKWLNRKSNPHIPATAAYKENVPSKLSIEIYSEALIIILWIMSN